MKNKIYYLGTFSCALLITGSIFKIMHWPGANIILSVSIFALITCFFPLAIYNAFKAGGSVRMGLYLSAFLTLFFEFLAAAFKTMHWPGASVLLIVGLLLPILLFLPVFLYYHIREKEESLNNFLYIIFFLVGLSGMSAFMAVDTSKNILTDITRLYSVSDLSEYLDLKTDQTLACNTAAQSHSIHERTQILLEEIGALKRDLLTESSERNDAALNESMGIRPWKIQDKYNREASHRLISESDRTDQLQRAIVEYSKFLNSIPSLRVYDKLIFIPDLAKLTQEIQPGEHWLSSYSGTTVMMVLLKLEEIENCIRLAELEALDVVQNKAVSKDELNT